MKEKCSRCGNDLDTEEIFVTSVDYGWICQECSEDLYGVKE